MYSSTLTALLFSFSFSSATQSTPPPSYTIPHIPPTYIPANADCHDYVIPVTVTSENLHWNGPKWTDDYGWIDFLGDVSTRPSAGFPPPFGNPTNETATYQISATFCKPKIPGPKANTVLVATHGLGFDRSYWNSPKEPEKYNFAEYLVGKGYSVFFYDRLGVGQSEKISGYKNQFSIQAAILTSLSKSIHSGKYTTLYGPPHSLVLIGHSFGSALTNAVIARIPTLINAAILTGFGLNASSGTDIFQGLAPRIAHLQRPDAFHAYDSAYLTNVDIFANINFFLKAPDYDRAIAQFTEATKQPFAVLELLSATATPGSRFAGPLLVAAGEFDYPFCSGYCPGVLDDNLEVFFPNAKRQVYVHPGAAHGVNFARNATGFYEVVAGFLEERGL